MKQLIIALLFALTIPTVITSAQYTYDLGIGPEDISFSAPLISGQQVRIYVSVHNYGDKDVSGYVTVYQGNVLIGDSQAATVRANSFADEVYVDFTVPEGTFNIRADINGQTPSDQNSANDSALTTLYVPEKDTDHDGIPDGTDTDDDNDGVPDAKEKIIGSNPLLPDTDGDGVNDGQDDFPTNPNETVDSDGDGVGDSVDTDDDNDGCSDTKESQLKTSPTNPDTDGDGVTDCIDAYPLDPTRSKLPAPAQKQQPTPAQKTDAPAAPEPASALAPATTNNTQPASDQSSAPQAADFEIPQQTNQQAAVTASISSARVRWNEYAFAARIASTEEVPAVSWDFGDGVAATGDRVTHVFPGSGSYTVSASVQGTRVAVTTVAISFFNIGNWKFLALIGGVIGALILAAVAVIFRKEE